MNLHTLSLEPIRGKTVAILGYGNQGRAHALNLRDSGIRTIVGARSSGNAEKTALADKFETFSLAEAARQADVVMLLLPDEAIPAVYRELAGTLAGKTIGFAHGFAFHFKLVDPLPGTSYFLVGPKGAGAILRRRYEDGPGLPGVFAIAQGAAPGTRDVATAYAKAIGCGNLLLRETTFQEETECDLFGEQSVLCGGIMELMRAAFETLVKHGHSEEMAFFECCYEARLILELFLKFGPAGMAERISPTAFYGGLTRGRRLITDDTRREIEKIFGEVRSGSFAKEWMKEVADGKPAVEAERSRLRQSRLQAVYERLTPIWQAEK
jgi:ketol-acid reductoisomerase